MTTFPTRKGVYPGAFNPPTIAHLAIADAAHTQRRLTHIDLVVSRVPFDKESVTMPSLERRLAVLRSSVADRPWMRVVVTDHRLLVDIAEGYDVLIMGADKWAQIHEVRFYDSPRHMADSLARLPELAIAARPLPATPPPTPEGPRIPPGTALAVPAEFVEISSSAARCDRPEWMTPAARAWADSVGGWPEPNQPDPSSRPRT